jgi:hypothetical protein
MKFVLVNHDTPFCAATCSRCARSIRSGYVRHVRTQQRYCGYDCYRRSEFDPLVMQWPMSTMLAAGNVEAAACNIIEMLAVLSAVSCWSCTIQIWTFARLLTGAYLDGRNLITLEGGDA